MQQNNVKIIIGMIENHVSLTALFNLNGGLTLYNSNDQYLKNKERFMLKYCVTF